MIELGRLTPPLFEPRVMSGAIDAFDAPVRVGTWEVTLATAAAPEPAPPAP